MFVENFVWLVSQVGSRPALKRQHHWRSASSSESVELLETRVVPAGVQVTPLSPLVTTESGGQAQFSVVLTSQPKSKVTVPVSSSNTKEGAVVVKKLVFTPTDWSTPQTTTVKGVEDTATDGNKAFDVVFGKFKSSDKEYKALATISQHLTNTDNDIPGLNVTAGTNLTTTEAGGTATFTVKLMTKPTANVVVPIHSSNLAEGTVPASLTFTPVNWNQAQTVTITGANDSQIDGNQSYQVIFDAAQSGDSHYAGETSVPISVSNLDNDVAGISMSPTPTSSLVVNEGGSKVIAFKLTAQPTETSDVTVTLTPVGGIGQATLSLTTLTFTAANWNVPQNVSINGLLGDGVDGDQSFSFTVESISDDPLFNALPIQSVTATIHNTEIAAAVTVTPKTGLVVNEGASKNVAFKLTTQPTADVTVILTTTDGAEQATLALTELTFTSANWSTAQNVAVNGLLGDGIDGSQAFSFDVDTVSDDPLFNVLPTQSITVTIHDSEAPAPTLDGIYTGSYTGNVSTFGLSQKVDGDIAATVVGNTFTMTQPVALTRTLPGDGTVNITIPISAAVFSGVTFLGNTVENADGSVTVSGTWTITKLGIHGGGTWSIRRAPLT